MTRNVIKLDQKIKLTIIQFHIVYIHKVRICPKYFRKNKFIVNPFLLNNTIALDITRWTRDIRVFSQRYNKLLIVLYIHGQSCSGTTAILVASGCLTNLANRRIMQLLNPLTQQPDFRAISRTNRIFKCAKNYQLM